MKISKLFHWLYAILMLLPAFAVGVTCAYAIFNKNAYQSYADYTQQTNIQISVIDNFEIGSQYRFNYKQSVNESQSPRFMYSNISLNVNELTQDNVSYKGVAFLPNHLLRFYNEDASIIKDLSNTWGVTINSFTLVLSSIENNTRWSTNSNYIVYSETLIGGKLSDVFYYSIDKVQQSPIFSWAYDSFLSTPITFITGLFGMGSDHVAIMFMSYWLAISVIWLVFDMIMYVPLLVHRWIDKGVLE